MSIYITGDKHRDFSRIYNFCERAGTTRDDIMIILGDSGINLLLFGMDENSSGTAVPYMLSLNIQVLYLPKMVKYTILMVRNLLLSAVHIPLISTFALCVGIRGLNRNSQMMK